MAVLLRLYGHEVETALPGPSAPESAGAKRGLPGGDSIPGTLPRTRVETAASDYDALPYARVDVLFRGSPRMENMADTNTLLVDDDRDTCASMSDIFSDLGYTVDMAYDGPGALELSGRHQYRLLYSISTCPAWMAWNSADT
jgi:hypothetical protein